MSDRHSADDTRWLAAAASVAARARPLSRPNPGVGAILVKDGVVLARGWTAPGGRPHAEAAVLGAAGSAARGATLYVTLEPCAHQSERGPACADLVAASGLSRVVVGCPDPDARTAGSGMARIRAAGVTVEMIDLPACRASLSGYLMAREKGRPEVTLNSRFRSMDALRWRAGKASGSPAKQLVRTATRSAQRPMRSL